MYFTMKEISNIEILPKSKFLSRIIQSKMKTIFVNIYIIRTMGTGFGRFFYLSKTASKEDGEVPE
jgi:hypothetical protein